MASLEAIRKITIQTKAEGADQAAADIKKISTSQSDLALASDKSSKAAADVDRALSAQQRNMQLNYQATQQITKANDDLSNSMRVANDNAQAAGKGILSAGIDFATATNHLKLLALGAYAMSASFRSFANAGIVSGIALIGPAATTAATSIISVLSPALAFLTRMAFPIGLAVAAWKLLNSIISTGSGLLDKYANAQRSLVANVDENLKKVTKFQGDEISLQQVQNATELGARLTEAKSTISDFFRISFDLTAPALVLQSIWVGIVEMIAKAVDLFSKLPTTNNLNYGGDFGAATTGMPSVLPDASSKGNFDSSSTYAALQLARQHLAAGMGSTSNFAVRFGQSINDLANPPKQDAKTANDARDAWDRATAAIDKNAAKLAADTIAVGDSTAVQAGLRAEFSLLEAAKISDRDVTDQQIQKYTEYRLSMTATQALQAAGIKWDADEKAAFDRSTESIKMRTDAMEKAKIGETISRGQQTAFLTPEDVQIANQLKSIYPDVATAINSTQAAALRLNQAISSTSQQISGGLTTALTDVAMGTKTAAQSFKDFSLIAIRAIEQMIIQLTIVGPLMRSLQSGMSGIPGLGGLLGGAGAASTLAASNSTSILPDVAFAFSSGGMVGIDGKPRYVHPAYFENAPRFDTGGMITDGGVPIIAHPGERVLNRQQTAAYNSGGGSPVNIHMGDVHIDASGADPAVVARLQTALAQDRKQRYSDVVKIVQDASNRGMRLHQ